MTSITFKNELGNTITLRVIVEGDLVMITGQSSGSVINHTWTKEEAKWLGFALLQATSRQDGCMNCDG